MSIDQPPTKIKNNEVSYDETGEVVRFPLFRKLFLPLVIVLISVLSFGLGRLSGVGEREALKIEYDPSALEAVNQVFDTSLTASVPMVAGESTSADDKRAAIPPSGSQVVASKNGERYHFLHCSGAKQIKEENKIVFKSPAEAEAAGYTLALNCKPR
ncbi:MAG: hypothetical protein WBL19_00445 [Minisyncoccia bacterium]